LLGYVIKKLLEAIPLIFGVTFISFLLMVYFAPDKTYDLLGRNPTQEQIDQVRSVLGYDRPFWQRYFEFVGQMLSFDFGHSDATGEKVLSIFRQSIPVSLAVSLPGFVLGNILSIFLALVAALYREQWIDRLIMAASVVGMSISLLIVMIVCQLIFSTSQGLNLFPVQGWRTDTFIEYLQHIFVPTVATVFVAMGYNTRFYRAVFAAEILKDHVRTARAFGISGIELLFKHVFMNSLIPVITRIVFTIPFLLISGSLLIESYFNIPGIGLVSYNAITTGDQPVLKAVITATAIAYIIALSSVDILYAWVDPRVKLQ
jgi:peptide/nickel transport system permease protein